MDRTAIYKTKCTLPINLRSDVALIDEFVNYLIKENCEGCTECEPRASDDWNRRVVCINQGRAKWLMDAAERFKEGIHGQTDGN